MPILCDNKTFLRSSCIEIKSFGLKLCKELILRKMMSMMYFRSLNGIFLDRSFPLLYFILFKKSWENRKKSVMLIKKS